MPSARITNRHDTDCRSDSLQGSTSLTKWKHRWQEVKSRRSSQLRPSLAPAPFSGCGALIRARWANSRVCGPDHGLARGPAPRQRQSGNALALGDTRGLFSVSALYAGRETSRSMRTSRSQSAASSPRTRATAARSKRPGRTIGRAPITPRARYLPVVDKRRGRTDCNRGPYAPWTASRPRDSAAATTPRRDCRERD